MELYDIVTLIAPGDDDLDGKNAFITRVKASASDSYDLFMPASEDSGPRFLQYNDSKPEKGDVQGVITDDSLKNPYKTLTETLQIEGGSLLVGTLRNTPTQTHPLKVIRITDNALVVFRTDDITETPIELPLENGIGIGSVYGFLQPALDPDDTEPVVHPDKQAFLDKLSGAKDITVVYTKTPVIPEIIEKQVVGGTNDLSRLTGQIVGAIQALDSNSKIDNTRIHSLIEDTTINVGDGRAIRNQYAPIMIRANMALPPWIIMVDESRPDGIVSDLPTAERIIDENEVNRRVEYHIYNRESGAGLQLPMASGTGNQEVTERMEVIFPQEDAIEISKDFGKNTHAITSAFPRKRVLLPAVENIASKNPLASAFRIADQFRARTAVILPPLHYAPSSAPIITRLSEKPWMSENIIDPDAIGELESPPTDIINSPSLLPREITGSKDGILAYVSPTIDAMLRLPMSLGSMGEIGRRGAAYGFNYSHLFTHEERDVLSRYLTKSSEIVINRLREKDVTVPIYSVSPKGLYRDLTNLTTLYPEIIGFIRKEEAFNRISQADADFGAVLLGMLGTDEYTIMRDKMSAIIDKSEGERTRIREKMAEIQEQLREMETSLRTLPMIAKHYGSRKEVEKAKGTTPLWDEQLDNDPDRHIYYSDRFRKIVGKILNEMQASGDIDIRPKKDDDKIDADDICDPNEFVKQIPHERLREAVEEDLDRYNLSVGESERITKERYAVIVNRIMLGGRPVQNDDVALITRHLRTSAYKWDAKNKRWNPIKDDEAIFAGNDIQPKANATRIFTQTLHLNKEYRQLSKMKDDLEMIARRPHMSLDPERLNHSLDTMVDRVSAIANKRIAFLRKNRVIDEIPFVHDRIKFLIERYSQEPIPEDGEDNGRITYADLRRAKMVATLETDTDLDLFEAGYGSMDTTTSAPTERFASSGSIVETDPLMKLVERRDGPAGFVSEVSGIDKLVRVFLISISYLEKLLSTPLSNEEIIMCAKEAKQILTMKANNKEAIQRGIAMYCAVLCTRTHTPVILPKAEGVTPPPASHILPSYRVPFRESESDGLLPFIVHVLTRSARTKTDAPSTTTFLVILKTIAKTGLIRTREDPEGKKAINILRDKISRIANNSPSIIARVIRMRSKVIKLDDTESGLRIAKRWEYLPITHNPNVHSPLIQVARALLKDSRILLRDPNGVPYPNNASLPMPVTEASLFKTLSDIHTTPAEQLLEILFRPRDETKRQAKTLTLITYAPTFIGVLRERIPTTPLVAAEVPTTHDVTPDTLPVIREKPRLDQTKITTSLSKLVDEIYREGELGHSSSKSTMESLLTDLRSPDDRNGALRSGMIAYHDALILALEQYLRIINSTEEPIPCEQKLYPSKYKLYQTGSRELPIYTIHEIASSLLKGINPLSIQYSKGTYGEKGGTRNTVLTGNNTYFSRIIEIVGILRDLGTRDLLMINGISKMVTKIRRALSLTEERIDRARVLQIIYTILDNQEAGKEGEEDDDLNIRIIELYITLIGHPSGVFKRTMDTSLVHSDVDDRILDEELNYDREKERQRFIYQLEALDPERRALARASRALGIDLAGKVARDPRKLNPEYYKIVNDLVATQEMADAPVEGERLPGYGDADDVAFELEAVEGAPDEVAQIGDLDYDE